MHPAAYNGGMRVPLLILVVVLVQSNSGCSKTDDPGGEPAHVVAPAPEARGESGAETGTGTEAEAEAETEAGAETGAGAETSKAGGPKTAAEAQQAEVARPHVKTATPKTATAKPATPKPGTPKTAIAEPQAPKTAPPKPATPTTATAEPQAPKTEPPKPAPAKATTRVPNTAHVSVIHGAGLQALLDADPRMQSWINQVMQVIGRCYDSERKKNASASGTIRVRLTMHKDDRPSPDIESLPPALAGLVPCATGDLMRVRMPLFTGPEGQKHLLTIQFTP